MRVKGKGGAREIERAMKKPSGNTPGGAMRAAVVITMNSLERDTVLSDTASPFIQSSNKIVSIGVCMCVFKSERERQKGEER